MSQDFPDDENGRVLRSIAEAGVDLSVEHEVEFAHLAPNGEAAEAFAASARQFGCDVEIFPPDEESLEEGDTGWDVMCVLVMVPSHENISRLEQGLAKAARAHGISADGWGFVG